jgi:hypothetical protein
LEYRRRRATACSPRLCRYRGPMSRECGLQDYDTS